MEEKDQLQERPIAEKIKKEWKKPEIYLLSTADVNSGGNPGKHEANFDSTAGTNPANAGGYGTPTVYRLHPKGAPASWWSGANHRLNFYYS